MRSLLQKRRRARRRIYPYALLPPDPTTEMMIGWISLNGKQTEFVEVNGKSYLVSGVLIPETKQDYVFIVKVEDLLPDTEYAIIINNVVRSSYRTLPSELGSRKVNIAFLSDIHIPIGPSYPDVPNYPAEIGIVGKSKPDILLLGGDIIHNGRVSEASSTNWKTFLGRYMTHMSHSRKLIPIFSVPGNHEYNTGLYADSHEKAVYHQLFFPNTTNLEPQGTNFGSITIGKYLQLIGLDLHVSSVSDINDWMQIDPEVKHVVSFHHSPFFGTVERGPGDIQLQESLRQTIFRKMSNSDNFKAMFCGHLHTAKKTRRLRVENDSIVESSEGIIEFGEGWRQDSSRVPIGAWYVDKFNNTTEFGHFWLMEISDSVIEVSLVKNDGSKTWFSML